MSFCERKAKNKTTTIGSHICKFYNDNKTKMKNQLINISLFYCSNSLSPEEVQKCASGVADVQINAISLPCSGRVNLLYLLKAIETGADGVMLLTCPIGECTYIQGNLRAQKRIEAVDDLLVEAGLERGCIKCIHLQEGNKTETLVNEISKLSKHLKAAPQLVKE
jgi:coenzyme F420-reducing hydrogenase delta subunit